MNRNACRKRTKTSAATQPVYFDIRLSHKQQLSIPVEPLYTVLIYIYEGALHIGDSDDTLKAGQLGELITGNEISVLTRDRPARLLLLAGMPLHGPVVQSGPFVMNSTEEIEQAYRDYRNGVLTRMDRPGNSC